ncbi:hypothetical protein COO60DRAFT_819685 [Scenedesmus sp. NREL 46B-D3]|nr:hypothetical protein COO60DRAFT_819685 [Scenedesmus sp. NREL 46B-D3]
MGYGLQTPLLNDGPPPSAPPLGFQQQPDYPQVPPPGLLQPPAGYPGPGVTSVPTPAQQQHMAGQRIALLQHQMPPAHHPAMESHTVHVHLTDDPHLTRIQATPRLHVCPACHSTGPTLVKRESGCCAWGTAFAMCWLCCPLFWLPFCLDCDRDLVHRCGVCGTEVARVKPWN